MSQHEAFLNEEQVMSKMSARVLDLLEENGINYVIHLP
jgi:hypothetical protein